MKTFLYGLIALTLSIGVGLVAYQLLVKSPGDVGVTDPTTGLCSVIYGGEDLREYGGVYLQRGAQLIDANPIATLSGNYIGGTDNVFASHPLENLDIAFYSALTTASATFENHLITMLEAGKPVVLITDGSQYSRNSPYDLIEKFGVNIAGNNYIGVLPIEETEFTRSSLSGLENLGFSTGSLLSDGGETGIYADKSEFTCQYTIPGKPNECVFAEVIYNGASGPTSLFIMTNIITTGHTAGVRGATFEEYDAAATNFLDKVLNFACTDYVYPVCNDGLDNDGDGLIDCQTGAEDPGCYPDGMGGGGECNPDDPDETDETPSECSDGLDNDGDGLVDCTAGAEDPGCFPDGNGGGGACNPDDDDETDVVTECSDGIDNDGDGLVDCTSGAEDPGCFPDGNGGGGACNPTDDDEDDVATQCSDGIDNDGDGFIDCTAGAEDPGCFPNGNGGGGACNPSDDNEIDVTTQCSDGIDNDGDGLVDCTAGAADPGCFPNGNGGGGACNPQDNNETDLVVIPATAFGDDSSQLLILGFSMVITGLMVYKLGFTQKFIDWVPNKKARMYEEDVASISDKKRRTN